MTNPKQRSCLLAARCIFAAAVAAAARAAESSCRVALLCRCLCIPSTEVPLLELELFVQAAAWASRYSVATMGPPQPSSALPSSNIIEKRHSNTNACGRHTEKNDTK